MKPADDPRVIIPISMSSRYDPPNLELGLWLQRGFVDFAEDMFSCCDDPASGGLVTDEGGGQGGQLSVGMGTWR